jgi:hypothetical protein
MQRKRRLVFFILVMVIGILAGLAYGWLLMPSKTRQIEISDLRMDYKADYVLMVAEVYQVEGNLSKAEGSLSLLGPDWETIVDDAHLYGQTIGYSQTDLGTISALAGALSFSSSKE